MAYNHISAYSLIDYKGMKIEKRRKQEFAKAEAKYEAMKEKLYGQYPELGKQYHYFKAGVCENEQEREVFETDWKAYLYYLENTSQLITFNQFFEASGLYESRTYNRDFAREWKQKQEHGQTDEQMKNEEFDNDNIIYFAGVKDAEALKKRYRDLLKIYHPDNQNGDTSTVQQIQKEYDFIKSKYGIN